MPSQNLFKRLVGELLKRATSLASHCLDRFPCFLIELNALSDH